ncbi:MAG: hypothetical protein WC763_02275 [Candidatus Paceibacterota bacterium]|jgi:hypothetical protein
MSVEFNEDNGMGRRDFGEKTPAFAAFLISKGIAKDVAGANKIQVIFSVVLLIISAYLMLK